jgi:hypothetical protein
MRVVTDSSAGNCRKARALPLSLTASAARVLKLLDSCNENLPKELTLQKYALTSVATAPARRCSRTGADMRPGVASTATIPDEQT